MDSTVLANRINSATGHSFNPSHHSGGLPWWGKGEESSQAMASGPMPMARRLLLVAALVTHGNGFPLPHE